MDTENASSKRNKLTSVSIPAEIVIHIVMIVVALVCVIPFVFVVIISFTSKESIEAIGYSFIPQEWSLAAYKYAIDLGAQLWRSYFNSFFTTIVGTAVSVLISILYAYGLFRKDFKFRNFFSFFAFFTMIFGGGLVPTIMVSRMALGLSNNYAALIVPLLINPFNLIVMRTFFKTGIPDSLIEAASIDGSGEYRTLFQIVVPIAKPGIATVALLTALAYWNEWQLSLYYLTSNDNLMPLQFFLYRLQQNIEFIVNNSAVLGVEAANAIKNMPSQSLRMALCVFIVVPIAFAYPFF